jgi:hypothetical protein
MSALIYLSKEKNSLSKNEIPNKFIKKSRQKNLTSNKGRKLIKEKRLNID